jgi:hypothetical protein
MGVVCHRCVAGSQPAHRQGHGLEPEPRRTAFTVSMFDAFMQRIMPGDDWRGE